MTVRNPPVMGQQGIARYWAAPHPSFCPAACVQLLGDQAEALASKRAISVVVGGREGRREMEHPLSVPGACLVVRWK